MKLTKVTTHLENYRVHALPRHLLNFAGNFDFMFSYLSNRLSFAVDCLVVTITLEADVLVPTWVVRAFIFIQLFANFVAHFFFRFFCLSSTTARFAFSPWWATSQGSSRVLAGGSVSGCTPPNFEVVIHGHSVNCATCFCPMLHPIPLWMDREILPHLVIKGYYPLNCQ